MSFILFNDTIIDTNEAFATVQNRALRYGDGVFESMRMLNGKIAFWPYHYERLSSALEQLNIENTELTASENILRSIERLGIRNKIYQNARIRITVYRAEGGLTYTPSHNIPQLLIEIYKVETSQYILPKPGIMVGIYPSNFKNTDSLANYKTNNSLLYVLASQYATQNNWHQPILLNHKGNIAEAGNSNIFILKNNTIYTPALSEGCVAGVMRKVIITLAPTIGINVVECALKPSTLAQADEIFLTNAAQGIIPVLGFEEKRYFCGQAEKLTLAVNKKIL